MRLAELSDIHSGSSRPLGPTPERLRKAGKHVEVFSPGENVHHRAIRVMDGHILERLASRGTITGDQHCAGTQFYADWYYGGMANSGVIDPGRVIVDGGKGRHERDRQLAALTRYQRAVRAIGPIHSTVLTDVVLCEEPLESWGRRQRGYKAPKQAIQCAKDALIFALDALVIHYYGLRRTRPSYVMAPDGKPGIARDDD